MTYKFLFKLLAVMIVFSGIITGCSANRHFHTISSKDRMMKIIFLDVGQADSTLLILPDGTNVLVDTGSPAAGPQLVDDLKSVGIKRIDHLIFTHPHDDHIGGIFNVLHEIEVGHFYDNGFDNDESSLFYDYVRLVREDPAKYSVLKSGDMLDFGRVKIAVLNPKNPPVDDINEDSIVLHVSYGKFSVLLAADAREVTEKHILATGRDIKSDILKVGHHGDRNASTEEFLRRVSPEIVVISVGQNNKYEKPHDEALSRLNASGAEVLRTDIHGNVIVETDGIAYSVYTEKK